MLDSLKSLFTGKRRCGVCLFKLESGVKSLNLDIGISPDTLFLESDYHEFTREGLGRSAGRGCKRCQKMASTFDNHQTKFSIARWWPGQPGVNRPYLELEEAGIKFELIPHANVDRNIDIESLHPCIRPGTRVAGSTGDDRCLDQAAVWLASCRKDHQDCHRNDAGFCPTRLLFLGDANPEVVRLVEKLPADTKYAALSHRWTEETLAVRLEHGNLAQRRLGGIPLIDFPQMMREVILLLRQLGIFYIWIDCMCIIQDDKEDWQREAATMASVYSSAEVTVAATWAGQSLFSHRDVKEYPQVDIDDTVLLRRSIPHFTWQDMEYNWFESDSFVDPDQEWPLLSRGWTYQEQLLSRRMLHFTRSELIWECNSAMGCECGGYAASSVSNGPSLGRTKQSVVSKSWDQIVKEYSKRDLTFDTDKLPALAGIAKAFSESRHDLGRYLCGLWENQLEGCFFWSLTEEPQPKPSGSCIPSWSWASVSGNVGCWGVSIENVEFLGVDVSYNGDPLMGEVKDARVTLSGALVPATLYYEKKAIDSLETSLPTLEDTPCLHESVQYRLKIGHQLSVFRPDYRLDDPGPGLTAIPSGTPAFCLIFGRSTSTSFEPEKGVTSEETAACFLALIPVDETNTVFERIGLFDGTHEEEHDYVDLETALGLSQKPRITLV